jgi:hypothetical protein
MAVPFVFGSATAAIPLSQLDTNFATTITLGNTAIQLGNTVTTLNNMTLGNVTITSGTSNITANVAAVTGILPEANGGTGTTTGYYGFKNRIINGDMRIDQRNNGAAVTLNDTFVYTVDRWQAHDVTDGSYTVQQSSTVPAGFTKSLLVTVTSADTSLGASQYAFLAQPIEGYNTADLGWGTANAQTITISFWVRSSLTGTFGGAVRNGAGDRSYPFTYTISSANTFEYKTVTIAGDNTGTWGTTTSLGINLCFGLGVGSTYSGTAGAWAASAALSTTGATNVLGTNGATFYITGVQFEKGTQATSFDFRSIGTELALCQRYLPAFAPAGGGNPYMFSGMVTSLGSSTIAWFACQYPVSVRTPATGLVVSSAGHFAAFQPGTGTTNATGVVFSGSTLTGGNFYLSGLSGVTAGDSTLLYFNNASSLIYFTGCEI